MRPPGATLGWAFERISRHPEVLSKLVAEAATDGNEYRQATILEVQRARTVIDFAGRHVWSPTFELGEWVIPQGYSIIAGISRVHDRTQEFPDPERFDPQRFIGNRPPTFALDSVRRRHPTLRGRGVRQRRDGRGATNSSAALHH